MMFIYYEVSYKLLTGALIGWEAISTLQKYNINLAFLGVNGIDHNELYTTDPEEAMIKAEVIKRAKQVYVLADQTKFNHKLLVKFATTNEVEIISANWKKSN
ncbi:DeoR/GlpR family DNA-binding transcription regulator [Spiroplasma mirum]|nr:MULTISPECIES: hypothetical protein [Spiroplasma]